jgi:hypothetical protein
MKQENRTFGEWVRTARDAKGGLRLTLADASEEARDGLLVWSRENYLFEKI